MKKENDIGAVENIIRWRNEIAQLEKEMSLLYLELEKYTDPLLIKFSCQEISCRTSNKISL
jgi:hypothetical protein